MGTLKLAIASLSLFPRRRDHKPGINLYIPITRYTQ